MIDKQKEHEEMIYGQYQFLVKCALLKKGSDEIDFMIKDMESIRRKVIIK
jgi:hypothetical protein